MRNVPGDKVSVDCDAQRLERGKGTVIRKRMCRKGDYAGKIESGRDELPVSVYNIGEFWIKEDDISERIYISVREFLFHGFSGS